MVQLAVIGFCFSKLETQWNTQIEYWDIFILMFMYMCYIWLNLLMCINR